ncbi:MAG: hypothetical protein QM679_00140 [Patulibacter sp.]
MRLLERILAEAEMPMRAIDLQREAERRLGEPVSGSSADSALWRDDVAVRKVGYGRYEAA